MTDNSEASFLAQLGYGGPQWGIALGYRYGQCGAKFGTAYQGAQTCANDVDSQNFALNAYWKPEQTGLVPLYQCWLRLVFFEQRFIG